MLKWKSSPEYLKNAHMLHNVRLMLEYGRLEKMLLAAKKSPTELWNYLCGMFGASTTGKDGVRIRLNYLEPIKEQVMVLINAKIGAIRTRKPMAPGEKEKIPPSPVAKIMAKTGAGAGVENWTNTEGKTIQASIAEIKGSTVVFLLLNGGQVEYDIAKLAEPSRKRIEQLRDQKAAAAKR